MLAILAATALIPITYGLDPGVKATYKAQVMYDGFIPLMGGQVGKVDVTMDFNVTGLVADEKKNPQATEELVGIEVIFNGAKLPIGLENVKDYFPKTTVSLTPQGKVVKTDAPDVDLPFRLPGLHIKRIPDVTYIPIEFPVDGIEAGKEFTFKKSFGDSDVSYSVTPTTIGDDKVEMTLKMSQSYEVLEDSGLNIVKLEKDAVYKVTTALTGTGKVVFDRKRKLVDTIDITADANSQATNLETKEKIDRKLKTSLKVKLQKA